MKVAIGFRRLLAASLGVALVAVGAAAQEGAAGQIDHETYELDNGLRVILSEDHSTPVVAVNVTYDVGSRDERRGRTGFAHLFEHMMFQGSEHVGKAEHLTRIESVGGSVNGTTSEDRTNYFETVPSDRYNLALWLEADRMRSLAVTEENFENQRETVKEERRQSYENQPYGLTFLQAFNRPFDPETCFPYAHSTIGSMEDLDAAAVEDVQAFFDTYYAPNRATLAVVGDFEPDTARALIERYFGDIESAPEPEEMSCEETYSPGFQSDTLRDENANLPAIVWTWRAPPHGTEDSYALALLANLFGQGESSRLHQTLVKDAGAALTVQSMVRSRRGPSIFGAFAIANQGVSPDSILQLFDSEVERLRAEPPTEGELEKARNRFRSSEIMSRQRVLARAAELQHAALFHDDVGAVNEELERHLAVTREDLRRVVDEYLTRENLTVLVTRPGASPEEETEAPASRNDASEADAHQE